MAFGSIGTPWIAGCGFVALLGYSIVKLLAHRRFYRDKPCPPHSLLWGHLRLMGETLAKFPPNMYLQAVLTQLKEEHNLPDIWYLDLWPMGPEFIIVTSPDAAAIPTTVTAFPQCRLVKNHFSTSLGESFIEVTNGKEWKDLHHMLAPGLTPAAVRSYHDIIIEEAVALRNRFRRLATSEKVIDFGLEFGKFPFEVVARVFFGERIGTQHDNPGLYARVRSLADILGRKSGPKDPFTALRIRFQEWKVIRHLWRDILPYIERRFEALHQEKVIPNRTTATNLVDRMLAPHAQNSQPLSNSAITPIVHNALGFMAAGFGTTSDTISYAYMLLGAFPETLAKLREEHDRVFDRSFDKTLELVRENPALLKDMKYTAAVIHETLRLFPIGFVVRDPPPDMKYFEHNNKKYPIKGQAIGICAHTMHFNPEIFPEPTRFNPDRFTDSNPSYSRHAYRPFERGLRSCLGQNLAMEEMKIALLMTARWFDFELTDHQVAEGSKFLQSDLEAILGIHAYQTMSVTASPRGPVRMKIRALF